MDNLPKRLTGEIVPELWELASCACNGALSPDDEARLETLLAANESARRFYGFYMLMHAELLWRTRGGTASVEAEEDPLAGTTPATDPSVPTAVLASSLVSAGTLLSYTFAALTAGVMMLATLTWTLPAGRQLANSTLPQPTLRAAGNAQPAAAKPFSGSVVVKVTGMEACRWIKPEDAARLGALVPEGRRYVLAAGKLELSYVTGAKVVIEGPADYEVDSPNSGFLSRGKLSFRVDATNWNLQMGEKVVVDTGAQREWPEKRVAAPGRYPAGHCPPRFLVATPSKTFVVNRDGRFVVAVSERGAVRTWLKQGSVELICREGLDLPGAIGAASGKFWGFVDKDVQDRAVRLICTIGEPPVSVLLAFSNRRTSLGDSGKSAGGPLWFENERGKKTAEEALNSMGLE